MSDSVVLQSSSLAEKRTATAAPRVGFGAKFAALLESLVSAQARRFENIDPLMFRYPPF
jgi:hypothetical protein